MRKKNPARLALALLAVLLVFGIAGSRLAAQAEDGSQEPEIWINPYSDVRRGAWYYDAVRFVTDAGLMNGTATTRFSPDETTSRAMVVTILWRQAGSPSASREARFSDVELSEWYGDAVRWAASNGIVTGHEDGTFAPEDTITREQMAAILYRYAQAQGLPCNENGSLDGYTDAHLVSGYAQPALEWVCGSGVMQGTSATTLGPAASATRAQVAAMLMRFCDIYDL